MKRIGNKREWPAVDIDGSVPCYPNIARRVEWRRWSGLRSNGDSISRFYRAQREQAKDPTSGSATPRSVLYERVLLDLQRVTGTRFALHSVCSRVHTLGALDPEARCTIRAVHRSTKATKLGGSCKPKSPRASQESPKTSSGPQSLRSLCGE